MKKAAPQAVFSRRELIRMAGVLAGTTASQLLLPAWARSGAATDLSGMPALSGQVFDLNIAAAAATIDGAPGRAILINNQLPAPLLRWRQGDEITLRVANHLDVDTSIHWHGILLPYQMDGVPGVSFPGIKPGETFTYRFPLAQAGTYWYHSHSGLQEQLGHYGPIVIEPEGTDPVDFDREYVVVLSDWTFTNPHRIFRKLKKMSDAYNFQRPTVGDFFADAGKSGLGRAFSQRRMWGAMRMNPSDISDVTGAAYTYLINGHGPADNWTGLFRPGERVRLRFINAAAMTIFNVRIPGLPMTIVQADGLNVQPVETDEFQIGVAETYDAIIEPQEHRAYTLMAENNDRSGFARATLSPGAGMAAAVPALRERPTLTMKDMAMEHGSHNGHKMPSNPAPGMDHPTSGGMHHSTSGEMHHSTSGEMHHSTASGMHHSAAGKMHRSAADGMNHSAAGKMDHVTASGIDHATTSGMDHSKHRGTTSGTTKQRHDHRRGPGVVGLAMNPTNRLGERPNGLEDAPHRVLVYTDLRSLEPIPDTRAPQREMELHLTGNMERYMWSFNGVKFSEIDGPIIFHKGERLRLTLVNDTMMAHPLHLHGMFFDVVTGDHDHKPRKHTIVVKPGEKLSVDITADAAGDWAFHCHLLYHMHAGMMHVVSVRNTEGRA